jgi:hypothetical protein
LSRQIRRLTCRDTLSGSFGGRSTLVDESFPSFVHLLILKGFKRLHIPPVISFGVSIAGFRHPSHWHQRICGILTLRISRGLGLVRTVYLTGTGIFTSYGSRRYHRLRTTSAESNAVLWHTKGADTTGESLDSLLRSSPWRYATTTIITRCCYSYQPSSSC